tara:strand:+ start:204 stop:521 length:318 start_codon:yes stop_codon:yes gene_type:complete
MIIKLALIQKDEVINTKPFKPRRSRRTKKSISCKKKLFKEKEKDEFVELAYDKPLYDKYVFYESIFEDKDHPVIDDEGIYVIDIISDVKLPNLSTTDNVVQQFVI